MAIMRLNHAVIKVRELERSLAFYERVLGLTLVARAGATMAFMRAPGSDNHHDLGLLRVGADAPQAPQNAPGLFHLAWQVENIVELREKTAILEELGAYEGASDHGATKSIYGVDPDGNEFEIMYLLPRAQWGEYESSAPTGALNLEREIAIHHG
ncbi:MAG: VOC family protein [Candidatus Velthaea sp.]